MHADFLIVQICDFLDDGDGMYRLHEPSRYLSRLPGVVVIDCHYYHHLLPELLKIADVVILQFIHNWELLPIIDQRRAAGKVTVFEANDNFYDVQPWNPIAEGWRDQAIRAEYRKYMSHCDGVQTSTDFLAALWKTTARQVAVFPNQLTHIPPLQPPPDRPLTIGWGGSPGHFADWYAIAPLLQHWLAAHPAVHLSVMSNELAKPFIDLPPERYHFTPFGTLSQYLEFLKSLDIGLAPLLPTGYNRGRSDVKFLEYALSGVPGIYSDLHPYRGSVEDGKTGLFYSTPEQLIAQLDHLAADVTLRQSIRSQAHQYVSDHRRLEQHIPRRLEFYRSLFSTPPAGIDIPPEVVSAADADDRYLRLRPGDLERAYIATLSAAPADQALATTNFLRRYPDYHHALLRRGRQLNDARQHADALAVLRRAIQLDPTSAAALCEMARAHYLLRDNAKAREYFESALKINPNHHPGWQYFLRYLRHVHPPDAVDCAIRARQAFPEDFGLALLAIALYPPPRRVQLLSELLELPAARPHIDETAAVVAFAQSATEALKATGATGEAAAMLKLACEVFPRSARLADMLGRLLFILGRTEESSAQYRRALELRRVAKAYAEEFPREDGTFHYWQFAEHIHEHRP